MTDLSLDNVRVLSHSAVRIEAADGTVLYFDPFQLSEEPHDADVVFITHSHYDHLSPADAAKVMNESTVVVAPDTCAAEAEHVLRPAVVHALQPGDALAVAGVQVEAVRAYNVQPERLGFHPKENDWLGYVVTADGVRYFVTGDTDENEDVLRVRCDVAFVPIGGTYTFDAAQAAAFVNAIRPQAVVPTHYGTAVGRKEDVDDFLPLVDPEIVAVVKMEWPAIG